MAVYRLDGKFTYRITDGDEILSQNSGFFADEQWEVINELQRLADEEVENRNEYDEENEPMTKFGIRSLEWKYDAHDNILHTSCDKICWERVEVLKVR